MGHGANRTHPVEELRLSTDRRLHGTALEKLFTTGNNQNNRNFILEKKTFVFQITFDVKNPQCEQLLVSRKRAVSVDI